VELAMATTSLAVLGLLLAGCGGGSSTADYKACKAMIKADMAKSLSSVSSGKLPQNLPTAAAASCSHLSQADMTRLMHKVANELQSSPPTAASGPVGSTQTYRAHGVSFDYPAGWQEESIAPISSGGAQKLWTAMVTPGTLQDFIRVEEYRVKPSVSARGIAATAPSLKKHLNNLFGPLGGGVQAGPEKITMAGMPAVRFRAAGTENGTRIGATLVFAFDGTSEYFVDCEYTPANTAEVERACSHVVDSFQVGR
jgi:hypothetical protein